MNITEANDVNTLLLWLLGLRRPGVGVPSSIGAEEAATRLADRAYKTLSAGLRSDDVERHWPSGERASGGNGRHTKDAP